MSLPHLVGWLSSGLLVLTIGSQLLHQWRRGSVNGVSPLLFIGQGLASLGLLVYSIMLDQTVFLVLNLAMFGAACTGMAMWLLMRRQSRPKRTSSPRIVPPWHTVRAARTVLPWRANRDGESHTGLSATGLTPSGLSPRLLSIRGTLYRMS